MISLSISTDTSPLTVNDTGTSGYVLRSWTPGRVDREITVATSRFVDGGALTSSRDAVVTMDAAIWVYGTSMADLRSKVDALAAALGQWDYTITETYSGGSAVYDCLPASYVASNDPSLLRATMTLVTAQIPRQP